MPLPVVLPSLTPREAIADALQRCLLGIDTNDHALFASACLQTPELTFTGAGFALEGWTAVDGFAAVLFNRTTMHMTSTFIRSTYDCKARLDADFNSRQFAH
jgi:hypothetical protein